MGGWGGMRSIQGDVHGHFVQGATAASLAREPPQCRSSVKLTILCHTLSVTYSAAPQVFELEELPVPKYCSRVVVLLLVEKYSARIPIVFVVSLL